MTAAAALTGLAGVATYVSSRSGASAGADTLRPAAVSLARALPTEASFTFGDSEAVAAGTASTAASTTGSENSCTDTDEVLIYKYTIASSTAFADGMWADGFLGCTYLDVTDTSGCAELGKTSCLSNKLDFGLHFVTNKITATGPKGVADWDAYFASEAERAFGKDSWSQFFHYALAFYAPDLTFHVAYLMQQNSTEYLLRQGVGFDGTAWYTLVVASPSGKTFEVSSTQLDTATLSADYGSLLRLPVKSWDDVDECPMAHLSTTYTSSELQSWYANLTGYHHFIASSSDGLPDLLPLRSSIAVPDVVAAGKWWGANVPALMQQAGIARSEPCAMLTTRVPLYTDESFMHEVRFVQNEGAPHGALSVNDFVAYIDEVNANYTGTDSGWSAWYDRHLGLQFKTCPLDDYMKKFNEKGISFHPHGRASTTINTGEPTDHCWTAGTQGYGLEMQGNFSYAYKKCYSVFDWCTTDTDPVHDICDA